MTIGYISEFNFKGIGRIWMASTARGICGISLGSSKKRFLETLPSNIDWVEDGMALKRSVANLENLSSGKASRFDEKLDLATGTPFQKKVWNTIAKIPWGETISYAELAKRVGKPSAFRAVANACGANPIPIIIPCHRVIASDGTIGGFSGGLKIKRKLLALEGVLK